MVGLTIFGVGWLLLATPAGCYRSATNELRLGQWAASGFRANGKCDPLAANRSSHSFEGVTIIFSFERATAPAELVMIIRPDGSGSISRRFDPPVAFSNASADYGIIREQIEALRDFSGTDEIDSTDDDDSRWGDREALYCSMSNSAAPNGMMIFWTDHEPSVVEIKSGDISNFDLGCVGPAGESLRFRAQIVRSRLHAIAMRNDIEL